MKQKTENTTGEMNVTFSGLCRVILVIDRVLYRELRTFYKNTSGLLSGGKTTAPSALSEHF